jgi:hypothetical protein
MMDQWVDKRTTFLKGQQQTCAKKIMLFQVLIKCTQHFSVAFFLVSKIFAHFSAVLFNCAIKRKKSLTSGKLLISRQKNNVLNKACRIIL